MTRPLHRELHVCGRMHKHQQRRLRAGPQPGNRRQALRPAPGRTKRERSLH